ncbi:hypothetical protein [Allokutzneria oryzae]|uniref:PE domain-containing protein n=1 Tax=Allokutzneria oryzae TaxID=1378989 RepID=A0ABV5ZTM9_9PSEU
MSLAQTRSELESIARKLAEDSGDLRVLVESIEEHYNQLRWIIGEMPDSSLAESFQRATMLFDSIKRTPDDAAGASELIEQYIVRL